ncbi:MAG: hypothetical protein AAF556_07055 [Pseudomonadota bacterium]
MTSITANEISAAEGQSKIVLNPLKGIRFVGIELPAINAATISALLIAGAAATLAFDLFGQALSPLAGFAKLAPVGLAKGSINTIFGTVPKGSGELLHYLVGLVGYPVGWLFFWQPLQQRVAPFVPWLLSAAVYGVFLWAFALYGMAHLVVGLKPFLGFTGITWVALVGHVLFAVVAAAVFRQQTR